MLFRSHPLPIPVDYEARFVEPRIGTGLPTRVVGHRTDHGDRVITLTVDQDAGIRVQGNRLNRDEMPYWQDSCLRLGPPQWFQSGKLLTSPPFFA